MTEQATSHAAAGHAQAAESSANELPSFLDFLGLKWFMMAKVPGNAQ